MCCHLGGLLLSTLPPSIPPSSSTEAPTLVASLSNHGVVKVTAGSNYSAAVMASGALYTWGKGSHGRLGHGESWGGMRM